MTTESLETVEQAERAQNRRLSAHQELLRLARRRGGDWRGALLRRGLAVADASGVLAGLIWLGTGAGAPDAALWAAVFLPAWLLIAKVQGQYDRDHKALRHLTVDELPAILTWSLIGTALLSLFLLATPVGSLDIGSAFGVWIIAAATSFVLRGAARIAWRKVTPAERTLIIGNGPLADATRRKLELFPDIHVELVGERTDFTLDDLERCGEWVQTLDRVILATRTIDEGLIAELVSVCRKEGVRLSVVPPARGMFGTAVQLNHIADLPVVEYSTWDVGRSTLLLKRCMDVLVSLVGLVALLPLLVLVAVAIKLDSRGPVFFRQRRAGKGGRPFVMVKFRTMVSDAEARLSEVVSLDKLRDPMFKLTRDPRVTRVGRILRRTSLDELPQLWNVLRGDMSLVGPRPEQLELVERYKPEHRFRLDVKPGLTGPMQVFGRGALRFDERLAIEREYIENLSLGRDLRILALTASAVASGRGAF